MSGSLSLYRNGDETGRLGQAGNGAGSELKRERQSLVVPHGRHPPCQPASVQQSPANPPVARQCPPVQAPDVQKICEAEGDKHKQKGTRLTRWRSEAEAREWRGRDPSEVDWWIGSLGACEGQLVRRV